MKFRNIEIEKDKELLIHFRRDTHCNGHETEEGFNQVNYLDRMSERVSQCPDGQLIIEDGHNPIGQLGLSIQGYSGISIGYVNLYYLIPEYRHKGLGKELINVAEEFFRKSGVPEYHLRVSPENESAVHLYTKIGMVKMGDEVDNDDNPVCRMRKLL